MAAPPLTQPLSQEVANKLQPGENPLDVVKKSLAALQQKPAIDPNAAIVAEEAKREEAVKRPEVDELFPETKEPVETKDETKDETLLPEEVEEPLETTEGPQDSVTVNFKKVRKVLRETKTQLSTTQEDLKKAREELDRYKTGEVLPDALQEKEAEITRLSKYEKLLSLKTSKEYQDKFVAPLTEINSKLEEIAKDYNIPPEVMSRAMKTSNRAELNRFLAQHFDDVGALEVKQYINQVQDLQHKASEAEQEPQTALQQLIREGEQAREQKMLQTHKELQTTVRSIWSNTLDELAEEGKAQELIYRKDDVEHNKNIVDPIVKHASAEFGKLIKDLVAGGLERLSPEAGKALAKTFLLGSASAVAMATREAVARHADEMESNNSRLRKIYRPPVGSMTPGAETVSQERRPMTPVEAGRGLINSVLAKKKA